MLASGNLGNLEPVRLGILESGQCQMPSGHLGIRAFGNLGIRESVHLGIWTSENLGIWASENLGI